jgi:hypothetical protein
VAHLMLATVVGGAMSWPDVPTVRVGATPDLVTLGPLGQATVHCRVLWGKVDKALRGSKD